MPGKSALHGVQCITQGHTEQGDEIKPLALPSSLYHIKP
jgi:hypothetical protein